MNAQTLKMGLAGMSMIAVAFGFARYGYGLFVPVFREEFGLSTWALGVISGATYATYLAALLLAGYLSTRLSPRLPVVIGGSCAAAGMLMIAAAPNGAVMAAGAVIASTSPGWAWAPFSDAVAKLVTPDAQNRTLSMVSTGTAVGLIFAGPIAMIAGPYWRAAWVVFAVLALTSTLWNARLLPGRARRPAPGTKTPSLGRRRSRDAAPPARLQVSWAMTKPAYPLYFVALVFGATGAFYWTYAADLAIASGLAAAAGPVLWSIVGLSGVVGIMTGDFVDRLGLGTVVAAALTLFAAAIATLGFAPGSWASLIVSALLYGPSFMMISALLALWSSTAFPERPSAGFTAALLLLAVGAVTGPATLGAAAEAVGLRATFLAAAALTLAGLVGALPHQRLNPHATWRKKRRAPSG